MSQRLPQEHPPKDADARVEWLTRLVILINGAFDLVYDLEPEGSLPTKISDGMFRFFSQAILPDILYAGPWIVINGAWEPMAEQFVPDPPSGVSVITNEYLKSEAGTDQNNATTDVNTPITFGAASGGLGDQVMMDAAGLITFNASGHYLVSVVGNVSRDSNNQTAYLVLSSVVNGLVIDKPIVTSISNSNEYMTIERAFPIFASGGDTLQFMQARDSVGVNDGGLFVFPTNVPGLTDVPSARILITSQEVVI